MVLHRGFHFVRQRLLHLIDRRDGTQVTYRELRGVRESWNMRSCLLSFTSKKVMNAEVFAKGLEKCRLLTTFLGQNVENLDDYVCPKIQDLVKTDSLWNCSSYLFDTKQGFTVPRGKQSVWRMGYATFVSFVRVYCICVYYNFYSFNST